MTQELVDKIYAAFIAEDERILALPETMDYGHPFTTCTHQARWIQRHFLPEAVVMGYPEEDNPTAKLGVNCGGHDFLVIDGRFIVDFWPRNVLGCQDVPLWIDMSERPEMVQHWYGDRSKWVSLEYYDVMNYIPQ